MPRKGMRSLFFSPKASRSSFSQYPSPSRISLSTPEPSFSHVSMERILANSESMIMKWNPETSIYAKVTSLFYLNRREAREFIKCVNELQKAMHSLVAEDANSEKLVQGQTLMEIAMKRLQKEFHQILSMNRAHLDPESVSRSSRASTRSSTSDYDDVAEDDIGIAGESITEVEDVSNIAMADLRSIAECMISSGYGKECVEIYKIVRKSIVDEGIYKLGVERMSSKIHKMDWSVLELRINNWLKGVKIAVKSLFNGERILCDRVFAASESIRESCFSEITRDGAHILFEFPEIVAKNIRKLLPEKVPRMLDMYSAISNQWPEIESIFSFKSTTAALSQAVTSLIKLGESVRAMLSEFESEIQKDSSKSPAAGGGVHPLTVKAINYLALLADYSNVLSDILSVHAPPSKSSLPVSYFDTSDSHDFPALAISHRFAWLILVLLCKLDVKSNQYKDVSLSYLFLANNLQHIVNKVRTSNVKYLLGDDWMSNHESKIKQYTANYERLVWHPVITSLPDDPTTDLSPEEVKACFRRFNTAFEQAHRQQSLCVVQDSKLRDEIKISISRKLLGVYREFYNVQNVVLRGEKNFSPVVRYAPEDVGTYLSDLFYGSVGSGSTLSSTSSSSHSRLSRSE